MPTLSAQSWSRRTCLLLVLAEALVALASPARAERDTAFWRALAQSKFQLPPGLTADTLILEVDGFLGSPDRDLRDGVAYNAQVAWIYRDRAVTPPVLRTLLGRWTKNLTSHLGESGNDTVLLRSTSALALSILAARDAQEPFLTPAERGSLVDAAVAYLGAERDLLGFEPRVGWIHATAHTADVLKWLARNPRLADDAARVIVEAIGRKLDAVAQPFLRGEDERLARALLAAALRPAPPSEALTALVKAQRTRFDALFATTQFPDDAAFARVQNGMLVNKSLCVLLDQQKQLTPSGEALRREILESLP